MRPTLYGDFERPASVEPEGAGHQPAGEAAPHALVGGHGLVVALPSPGRVGPGDLPEGVLHIAGRTEPGGGLDQGGETGGEALEAGGRPRPWPCPGGGAFASPPARRPRGW